MTAPGQQAAPEQADLRQRIAQAQKQRAAARAELGAAGERIAAIAFDLATGSRVVAPDEVYAAIAAHRAEVLAVVEPELAALREQLAAAQAENERLRTELATAWKHAELYGRKLVAAIEAGSGNTE